MKIKYKNLIEPVIKKIIAPWNDKIPGFKLLEIELVDNPELGNLHLLFCDDLDNLQDYPFSTVLIGPNGTGKSNILKTIINLFRELDKLQSSGKRGTWINGGFSIAYLCNGFIYTVGNLEYDTNENSVKPHNRKAPLFFYINGVEEKDLKKIKLPVKIIANSLMVTDKYPYLKEGEFKPYIYLGIRSSRSSAGTRAYVRKTVELLKNSIGEPGFVNRLRKVLEYMGLETDLNIVYKPVYAKFFYRTDLTVKDFHEYFSNQKQHFKNRTTQLWGTTHYDSIKEDDELIQKIVQFLQLKSYSNSPEIKNSETIQFHYNILSDDNIAEDFEIIQHLTKLDLISFPSISLSKQNSTYALEDSSSGEYNLLASFIGLIASVKENSLVFIDEPEVSLHPNWQMKYMHYVKQLFNGYQNCHFIIATHSHFFISDIEKSNSQVIGLKKEPNLIPVHFTDANTYGWSAEEVLYSIFNVNSSRNFFIDYDVLSLISKLNKNSKDFLEMRRAVSNLKKLNLSPNDPLTLILEKGEKYLIKNNA